MCKPGDFSDEAMYELLHDHLNKRLKRRFEIIEYQLLDSFDDVIDDFYLYLRDGINGTNKINYESLYRIKNPEAFEAWIVSTFRNYLSLRASKEGKIVGAKVSVDNLANEDCTSSVLTDEQKLAIASNLIAYAHQTLSPRDCFILFRTLLTMLNKKQALPNETMTKVLGMSDIAYRVTVHRMKSNLAKYRTQLLQGRRLELDEKHQTMAQKINDDFLNLYPTLLVYYDQIIDTLGCADAIKNLRLEYFEETGVMMHEAEAEYSVPVTIEYFWNKLEMVLFISPPPYSYSEHTPQMYCNYSSLPSL